MSLSLTLLLATRLVRLNWLDTLVIVMHFATVLGLGHSTSVPSVTGF